MTTLSMESAAGRIEQPTGDIPRSEAGFTLIELMAIAFIVSLLAVIALPLYQDYAIRSKVGEGLTMMSEAKSRVGVYYATNFRMPQNAQQAALQTNIDTDIVASLLFDGERITLVLKPIGGDTNVNNRLQFSLKSTASGTPQWTCKPGETNPLDTSYLPPVCR
jgi:type IV pilus assembly protein PilA